MPHWQLSWQLATIMAACFFAVAGLIRLTPRQRQSVAIPCLRESGLVVSLYALWQYAGTFSLMGTADAIQRGQWLWDTERAWHLPSEAAAQHLVLPRPLLVEAFNIYYAVMHFMVLIVFLVWLFARHREHYAQIRAILVCFTAASLLIQLVPVAPPRMLTGVGLIDTAAFYDQSVYAFGGSMADQFSAMPSVHVGWAMLIAFGVWRVTSGRARWVALAHAVLTWVVVVATANHFWLDGMVATALLAIAVAVVTGARVLPQAMRALARLPRRGLATSETPADKLSASADVRSMGVR